MIKVSRKGMIEALGTVQPGLAKKEIVEQANHFAFTGDEVATFNDFICVVHPFKTDFICSVSADELYRVLNKIDQDEIELSCTEKEIKINAGKTKAAIKIQSGDILMGNIDALKIDKIKKWSSLPKDFVEGMTLCIFSASKDMTNPTMTGVYVDREAITSTDDLRISQYLMDGEIKGAFLIAATTASELIKFDIVSYAIKDGWAFFKTKNDAIFCAQLMIGAQYPNVDRYFEIEGVKFQLPETLKGAIETAMTLAKGDTDADLLIDVHIGKNSIKCRGSSDLGWIENELEGKINIDKEIQFSINPVFLLKILEHTHKVEFGTDRLLFKANDFYHLISIRTD